MYSGLEATQKDDYPITVMTGHSIAEIILSPERIDYTAIESPDYLIAISKDGVKRAKEKIEKLSENCTLIADESIELPETKAKVIRLPIAETSKKVDRLSIATVALATLLKQSSMFPIKAFETAIAAFQKANIAETNIKAVKAGAEMVERG